MNKHFASELNDGLDEADLEQVSGGFCGTPPGSRLPIWPPLPLPLPSPRPPVDPVRPPFPPVFPPPTIKI